MYGNPHPASRPSHLDGDPRPALCGAFTRGSALEGQPPRRLEHPLRTRPMRTMGMSRSEAAMGQRIRRNDDPRPGGDGGRRGAAPGGVEPIPLSGNGGVQPPRACITVRAWEPSELSAVARRTAPSLKDAFYAISMPDMMALVECHDTLTRRQSSK